MEDHNTEEDIWAAHVLMRFASGGLHHAPPRPVLPVLPAGHAAEEADDAAAEQLQQEQQQQLQEQLHQDQDQQQQQQQEQGQEQEQEQDQEQDQAQDQEQQAIFAAHLRASIQIPQLWEVKEEDWPAEALALARLPPQRSVQRLGKTFLANPKEWNMTAAVGQCVGEEAAEPCSRCRRGGRGGRFTGGCIVLPAGVELKKKPLCCLNCRYQWQYNQCSFIQNQQQ